MNQSKIHKFLSSKCIYVKWRWIQNKKAIKKKEN